MSRTTDILLGILVLLLSIIISYEYALHTAQKQTSDDIKVIRSMLESNDIKYKPY